MQSLPPARRSTRRGRTSTWKANPDGDRHADGVGRVRGRGAGDAGARSGRLSPEGARHRRARGGCLVEKALAVDNLFVFLVAFSYFAVPAHLQHRVLFWGIIGALITRGIFIAIGAALLANFHFVIYIFGAFLIFTAVRLLRGGEEEPHPEKNPVLRLFRRFVRLTPEYVGSHFFVRQNGKLYATPLLMVLVVIEATDVVFAVDSIPAVFGVTSDVFIVYTSNIFAVLGLRALLFLVASVVRRLKYLRFALALVLAFVGLQMLLSDRFRLP